MAARAFCIRLTRLGGPITGWISYRAIEIDGSLLRVVLCEAQEMGLMAGESVTLETCLLAAEVMVSGIVDNEVLILELQNADVGHL